MQRKCKGNSRSLEMIMHIKHHHGHTKQPHAMSGHIHLFVYCGASLFHYLSPCYTTTFQRAPVTEWGLFVDIDVDDGNGQVTSVTGLVPKAHVAWVLTAPLSDLFKVPVGYCC